MFTISENQTDAAKITKQAISHYYSGIIVQLQQPETIIATTITTTAICAETILRQLQTTYNLFNFSILYMRKENYMKFEQIRTEYLQKLMIIMLSPIYETSNEDLVRRTSEVHNMLSKHFTDGVSTYSQQERVRITSQKWN